MVTGVSQRIAEFVDALPVVAGTRILEIGCGPSVAARELLRHVGGTGFVLAIDRSKKAISLAARRSTTEVASGRLEFRCVAAEDFELSTDLEPFDLAFAMRVGAFDGRYPEVGKIALSRLRGALKPGGRFFVDGGSPLREIPLSP